jgi:hypothetical protein
MESGWGSIFLLEHDLFRKPDATFRDHALVSFDSETRTALDIELVRISESEHQRLPQIPLLPALCRRAGFAIITSHVVLPRRETTGLPARPGAVRWSASRSSEAGLREPPRRTTAWTGLATLRLFMTGFLKTSDSAHLE